MQPTLEEAVSLGFGGGFLSLFCFFKQNLITVKSNIFSCYCFFLTTELDISNGM